MFSPYLTELSLRAAVINANNDLTLNGDQTEDIKAYALKQVQRLQGNGIVISLFNEIDEQRTIINIAIDGLKSAYKTLSDQIRQLKDQRFSFDKERQTGIATFILPNSKEENQFSIEEKSIKSFIELSSKSKELAFYFGIQNTMALKIDDGKFYATLPFYRMSNSITQPETSKKLIEHQRIILNLFFKSEIPKAIADIDNGFQSDWPLISFWQSAYRRKNYLNNRRAPRFIMICLSNLLWNLLYPIDPKTGLPLTSNKCIELCKAAEIFLNHLLNKSSENHVKNINNYEDELMSFIRKIKIHTQSLHAAYLEDNINELNITDLTHNANKALSIMDNCLFKLIYKKYYPIPKKAYPDDNASENMAYNISYLNQLITLNPHLIENIQQYPNWISHNANLNNPPSTLIDLLIIYCHLSWQEREQLIEKIEKSEMLYALELASTLKKLHKKFIKPIKDLSKKDLKTSIFDPKHHEVCSLTTSRVIPLITLIIKDFHIEIDNRNLNLSMQKIISGKRQVQLINQAAEKGISYYHWSLSSLIIISDGVEESICELNKKQYRMSRIAELLNNLHELMQKYNHFIQHKEFQKFILKCLYKIKEEYEKIDYISTIDLYLAHDEIISRNFRDILSPMIRELNVSLDKFLKSSENIEQLVTSKSFSQDQRELMAEKIKAVSDEFSTFFTDDSGITNLSYIIPKIKLSSKKKDEPTEIIMASKIEALKHIVKHCYNEMSYMSKKGRKGLLLREILTKIEKKHNYSEPWIKNIVLELTKITASYRVNYLFHANYGTTRSSKALIAAILDRSINKILPLAAIIFDDHQINIMKINEEKILQRINNMQEEYFWPLMIDDINLSVH